MWGNPRGYFSTHKTAVLQRTRGGIYTIVKDKCCKIKLNIIFCIVSRTCSHHRGVRELLKSVIKRLQVINVWISSLSLTPISACQVILYPQPDFQGECHIFKLNQDELPEKFLTKSCRVSGARWGAFPRALQLSTRTGNWSLPNNTIMPLCFSWLLYEAKQHSGNMYILSEGDYPNLSSMGCPPVCNIRSVKVVPMVRRHF